MPHLNIEIETIKKMKLSRRSIEVGFYESKNV